jgi:hypothetical protein
LNSVKTVGLFAENARKANSDLRILGLPLGNNKANQGDKQEKVPALFCRIGGINEVSVNESVLFKPLLILEAIFLGKKSPEKAGIQGQLTVFFFALCGNPFTGVQLHFAETDISGSYFH